MSNEINTELNPALIPDAEVNVKEAFGIDQDLSVPAFSEHSDYVPEIDKDYRFDRDTTLAILAGFSHNPVSYTHLTLPTNREV